MGIAIVAVLAFPFVFGSTYSNTARDRAKLQALCDPVKDVPLVIEAHHSRHGSYPSKITALDPSLANATEAVDALAKAGFVYSSDSVGYRIYRKLNWDGGIFCESGSPWKYGIHGETEWPIY